MLPGVDAPRLRSTCAPRPVCCLHAITSPGESRSPGLELWNPSILRWATSNYNSWSARNQK